MSTAIVVGGGSIGGAVAWELFERGFAVTIVERADLGGVASRTAAGGPPEIDLTPYRPDGFQAR